MKTSQSCCRFICYALILTSSVAFISSNSAGSVLQGNALIKGNKSENAVTNNMLKTLELYDLSFLKLNQLVIDGLESNPGPVNYNTPKVGRPKKRSFNFKGKKLDFDNVNTESKFVVDTTLNNTERQIIDLSPEVVSDSNDMLLENKFSEVEHTSVEASVSLSPPQNSHEATSSKFPDNFS